MIFFKAPLIDLKSSVWSCGIIVPTAIANEFLNQNDKRVVCTLNKTLKIHAALMPKGDNTWFININKECQKTLKLKINEELDVDIETDSSKYGMEVPEEFEEMLVQDPEGRKLFENLTMGKQRTLIHLVFKIKNSMKRAEKSFIIMRYLKDVNGNLEFKGLNEALKSNRY